MCLGKQKAIFGTEREIYFDKDRFSIVSLLYYVPWLDFVGGAGQLYLSDPTGQLHSNCFATG
jgi:hypothetical protein